MCTNELVQFLNIQNYILNLYNSKKIIVEYIVDEKFRVTLGKDYVGLVSKGIDIVDFDLKNIITYELVLNGPVNENERRFKLEFSLKGAKNLNYGQEYMFVYSNNYSEVLGASKSFKFFKAISKENLMNQENNNNEGEEPPNEELFRENNNGRNRRAKNTMVSLQQAIVRAGDIRLKGDENAHNNNRRLKQAFDNQGSGGDSVACQGYGARYCSNCKRVGDLLHTQHELFTKVKNLAERNKDLECTVTTLHQQLELGHAAYQKVCVQLMCEREFRLCYLEATRDTIQCQMAVETGQSGALVSTNVGHEKRLDDKTKLRMKAIMGRQEEKIRMLTEKINELEFALAEKEKIEIKKVKAVMKDLGERAVNDNDGATF